MKIRNVPIGLLLVAALLLQACGDSGQEKPQPLGKLDIRPTAEFGMDATILALQLGKEVVDARAPDNDVARAEGYRYLLRQVEMHQAMFTADQDPLHPGISRCPTRNCRLGFDSPDYSYVGVQPLSADVDYRLYGNKGNSDLVMFQVLERSDGPFKGSSRTNSLEMEFAEDGTWEIFLGREKPANVADANFLKLAEDNATMLIRIVHNDWLNTFEPSFHIEVLGEVDEAPEPFTPMRMAATGFALSKVIPNQLDRWVKRLQAAPLNAADEPCTAWGNRCEGDGGFGNWSTGGRYLLQEDEALIIEAEYLPLVFQNIQLGNIWAESLDYGGRQTSLNGFQAHRDSDNKYRYVLAHRDPGVPNWLDVSDHPEGSFFMRWVYTEDGAVPARPKSRVVAIDDVRDHLPADTPAITAGERAAALGARALGYQRRMNPAGLLPHQ
jgi:Protein of unknown function (DUF1214)